MRTLRHQTSARKHWVTWAVLLAGLALIVAPPLFDTRPGLQSWTCIVTGALFALSALSTLVLNPTWGFVLEGRELTWWHDAKRLKRTVSVDELRVVHVHRDADMAELESMQGAMSLPRDCLKVPAEQFAAELHHAFPHIELRVD
ncbi:MAG: hypothetical protein QM817_22715 [Archangium sp.]